MTKDRECGQKGINIYLCKTRPRVNDARSHSMGKKATVYLLNTLLGIFTAGVAALTFCGWLASGTDPCGHGFIALMGLALPVLLAVDVLLVIYWTLRRRWWALLPVAAVVLNWNFIASTVRIGGRDTEAYPEIKVVTYNVDGFRRMGLVPTVGAVAAFLESVEADIACIQEFQVSSRYGPDSIRNVFSTLPYAYMPEGRYGKPNMAFFSRYPIIDTGYIPFPDTDNSALWADVSVNGRRLRVISNHLQTTSVSSSRSEIEKIKHADPAYIEEGAEAMEELAGRMQDNFCRRARQAELIRRVADTTDFPVIVCGDFNDTPASYVYNTMKGDLTDGFRSNGRGYGYTYRGFKKLLRIDYVLFGKGLEGVSYRSPAMDYSDHNPVVMGLGFTDGRPGG